MWSKIDKKNPDIQVTSSNKRDYETFFGMVGLQWIYVIVFLYIWHFCREIFTWEIGEPPSRYRRITNSILLKTIIHSNAVNNVNFIPIWGGTSL